MTASWRELDKGTEQLILVGPARKTPLHDVPGLKDVPQLAVDGGDRFAVNPVLWAGDGDSGQAPTSIPAFIKHDQNITDFRFCLNGIRDWRWRELHLFGFLGGRRDHELANFGEIHVEMKARAPFSKAVLYGENNLPQMYFFQAGEHAARLQGVFSVLVLEPAEITIAGECLYPAGKISLQPFSGKGISNEASGIVKISSSGPFMLLTSHTQS